jgi:undecaprenyl pyrophosphate synthase
MAAGVDLLEVRFSGDEADFCFESANLWPDLSRADLADAVLQYLQNDSRRSVRRR